ncbi:MAG: hypothetical protein SFZ23_14690 [Planctomycetota bacterium]|nr:hypothetical protein [Planctomycetota bacterium]
MNERHEILLQTARERDKAEALLRELIEAKARSEQHLIETRQVDPVKKLTGRSSIDNAIASTKRMIETLNRHMDEFRRELSDDDAAMLEGRTP